MTIAKKISQSRDAYFLANRSGISRMSCHEHEYFLFEDGSSIFFYNDGMILAYNSADKDGVKYAKEYYDNTGKYPGY